MARQAVDEYRKVMESPEADDSERQEVFLKCGALLGRLGRSDDMSKLQETLSRHSVSVA